METIRLLLGMSGDGRYRRDLCVSFDLGDVSSLHVSVLSHNEQSQANITTHLTEAGYSRLYPTGPR